VPREWRTPGALEMEIAADTVAIDDLAQQYGPPITKGRHEITELVPSVGHGQRFGVSGHASAAENGRPLIMGENRKPQVSRERLVKLNQTGLRRRSRLPTDKKPLGQPGVAIIEWRSPRALASMAT